MPKAPELSVASSSSSSTIPGPAKRRSVRIPRQSEEVLTSPSIGNAMGDEASAKNVDPESSLGSSPALREGWNHPAELQYIRRADWSQDLMITYLCQKAFTVPPRLLNSTLAYIEITRSFSGEKIAIPRGYRLPLMFVARFQWESLRLVLNSASEWEEYKFDIIHLSRLCTHFFKQAKSAASENKLSRAWRSPMFDRALIRFYRKWMVSREWSVKKFWEEYDEDEYQLDVLKFDWSRWVLKGHKGFALTKEEVQHGITADQYRDGLKRKPNGTWVWGGDDSGAKDATSLDALNNLASPDAVEAITNAIPSHDTIEVKQELFEISNDNLNLNTRKRRKLWQEVWAQPVKKKKVDANSSRLIFIKSISPPSDVKGLKDAKGNQPEEDTVMNKDYDTQSFSLSNAILQTTKQSVELKSKLYYKPGASSLSTTTTTAATLTNVPSDQKQDMPLISAPISNGKNGASDIFLKSPLLVPSGARMLNATLPVPRLTKPLSIATSASLLLGVSNNGEENIPTSAMSVDPSMQTDSVDHVPEILPNVEVSDLSVAAVMAPLLPQSSILPSPSATEPLTSTNSPTTSLPVTTPPPSSSFPGATLSTPMTGSTTLTPNPNLPDSCSLPPNIQGGAHTVSVILPSLPYCADISDGPDAGDVDLETVLPKAFIGKAAFPKLSEISKVTATVIMEGSGPMEIKEEKNLVEDLISIPLSPVLSRSERSVHPASLTFEAGEVEPIVVRTQSVVEEVDVEDNGTGSKVRSGEDAATIVPAESGSGAMKGEAKEGGEDMVDEQKVVDTMDSLMDDTNEVDVRIEKCVVEAQLSQETLTEDDMDRVDVVVEKGEVEVQPVHIQSRRETPAINDTDGMDIALKMGAIEGQPFNSQLFMAIPTAPLNGSKAAHRFHAELQGGDSQGVRIAHADDSEDKMNVDEEATQPIQPTAPLSADGNLATNPLFMTSAVRTKSLHSIQLLQGLIHFLRMPARDSQPRVSRTQEDDLVNLEKSSVVEQGHYPLLTGPYYLTEEAISVDQRLDVIAQVSITLAKNLYPYRGKELETRIDLLDKSLQKHFEMDESFKDLDARLDAEFDRNTASASMSTEKLSQGVQTSFSANRQFESVEVQTEAKDEVLVFQQPLSADATMTDLTVPTFPLQELPSIPAAKGEPQLHNNGSIAKTVMSMMRNMADLLECTTSQRSERSLKGKEKEVMDVDMIPGHFDSPVLTTLLEGFKGIKEEMRRTQYRSQSEVESMKLSHFMEVEALKDEIQNIVGKGKRELDEVTRHYLGHIGKLKTAIRLREERDRARDREKESGVEAMLPSLELLEIRRRVASLEARSRSDSVSADMLRSTSRSSMTNGHLSHLIPTDFEEQPYSTTFSAPRQFMREGSMSKPGTPVPSDRNPFSIRHPDAMDLDESMPLPAKSQRKMHMMNFARSSMG